MKVGQHPICLVGLPGSGKSTVGRQLSRRLQLSFYDSDKIIEESTGSTVKEIFAREGEDRFRSLEELVIDELTQRSNSLISTGGGAVLRTNNRINLRKRCYVVYLKSAPEELARRLKHDTQRPLLQVDNPLVRLRELFAMRDPLYREIAHFIIETGRPSVGMLVNMIVMQLELAGVVPVNP